jgi:hypothetical protein
MSLGISASSSGFSSFRPACSFVQHPSALPFRPRCLSSLSVLPSPSAFKAFWYHPSTIAPSRFRPVHPPVCSPIPFPVVPPHSGTSPESSRQDPPRAPVSVFPLAPRHPPLAPCSAVCAIRFRLCGTAADGPCSPRHRQPKALPCLHPSSSPCLQRVTAPVCAPSPLLGRVSLETLRVRSLRPASSRPPLFGVLNVHASRSRQLHQVALQGSVVRLQLSLSSTTRVVVSVCPSASHQIPRHQPHPLAIHCASHQYVPSNRLARSVV